MKGMLLATAAVLAGMSMSGAPAQAATYALYTATYEGTGSSCSADIGGICTGGTIRPVVTFTLSSDNANSFNFAGIPYLTGTGVGASYGQFFELFRYSADVIVNPTSMGSGPLPFLDTANLIGGSYSFTSTSSMGGGLFGSARIVSVTTVFADTPFPGGPTANVPPPSFQTAAAPEPSAWALMVLGFGIAGAALRRKPRVALRFA